MAETIASQDFGYHCRKGPGYQRECHGFGGMLEPRYIVGAESLDQ